MQRNTGVTQKRNTLDLQKTYVTVVYSDQTLLTWLPQVRLRKWSEKKNYLISADMTLVLNHGELTF